MKTWIEVEARFTERPPDMSPYAEAFERYGCNSSLETAEPPAIRGYLESSDIANRLRVTLLDRGADEVLVNEVPDEDWSEIWKQHFKPRRVGKRMVVVPSWEDFKASESDVLLKLDPGQAFGTGEHPTTRLCLELLEDSDPIGKKVLDIGCGSGILAIAASKLGASHIIAVDIDEGSVEIAKENASVNQVPIDAFASEGFEEWSNGKHWDIVLSNIVSATIVRITPDVAKHLSPNGDWIVSGILQSNWKDVEEVFLQHDFKVSQKKEEDEWIAATLRRPR